MKQSLHLVYDPRLVEEAAFLAQRHRPAWGELQERRSRIYEITDLDERERRFNELNRQCFDRLGLGSVIKQSLQEQPLIGAHVERCVVIATIQAKEEGAELFVLPEQEDNDCGRRTLRLLLRPESFLQSEALRHLLRHELFHISDMLDPVFGYQPTLPQAEGGPTYDSLITNRYRALWDVTIASRMLRRGWCAEDVRGQQLDQFRSAFPMLNGKCEEYFKRFFDALEPHHDKLVAFALDPRAAADIRTNQTLEGTHCPLCRFPSHTFEFNPADLGSEILAAIKKDFADWTPAKGLCVQCADLYRGRQMSMDALGRLPGYRSSPI